MRKSRINIDGGSIIKANKRVVKRKRDDDDDVWEYYLKSRMSPKMLVKFINGNLSAKQIADVKAMGFGGLLTIKTDNVPGSLAYWIVSRFNTCSSSLMDGKLQITDEDIHLATGIPMGSKDVEITSKSDKSEDFLEFKRIWLNQFNENPTKVATKDILNLIIGQRDGGEAFQRNFIVFIVSAFLMGVKGTFASLRVLKCLRDISSVPSLNWCGFTRKKFIEGVESWRKSKNDFFSGPIMVFVLIYLDRVSFKYYSVPRLFPTIASWSKEAIINRIKCEQVEGFGTGGILPRIVKGNVGEEHFSGPSENVPSPEPSVQEPKISETTPSEKVKESKKNNSSTVKKLAECANSLASAYEQFSEALTAATADWPESKIVQQMAQMAEALSECSYSSQPDCDVKGKKDEVEDKEGNCKEDDSNCPDPCRDFAQLKFETEEELFAALVKLETALGKRPETTNIKSSSPIFVDPEAKSTKVKDSSPVFIDPKEKLTELKVSSTIFVDSEAKSSSPILVDSESQEFEPLNFEKKGKGSSSLRRSPRFTYTSPPTFTPPSFKLLSSESQEDDVRKVCDEFIDTEDDPEIEKPLQVSPIASLPPKEAAAVTRTISKRNKVVTEVFRSPFLQRNIRVDGSLSKIEKEVLEHVFSESSNESEILFQSDQHQLTRRDLKSLLSGDKVPKSVIHTWCCILNKSEKSRSRESPSRLYLLQTSDEDAHYSDIDDHFTGAALIFVPVVSEKPFAFCFNFLTSKLEILHLMTPKTIEYQSAVKSTQEFVIRCLANKMSSIEQVHWQMTDEFVPKSNLCDGIDSGIYLMRLLEKYKGTRKGFAMGLQDNNQVKIFGARVCFEILSFGGNRLKDKVFYDAGSFSLDIRYEVSDQKFLNPRQPRRQLTDTELLGFVINSKQDKQYLSEIVIDTEWMQVNRKELRTLQNRQWVMDTVIDMYGVMCTYNREDILYLPSTVKFANAKTRIDKVNIVWCPYLKMHYKPQNGATIDKVFFTIEKDKHWFACVSDLKKKKNYILDSLKPNSENQEEHNSYVEDIIFEVTNRMDESNGYDRLKSIVMFDTVNVDVPQQPNIHDCGVYVMKFLEGAVNDTNLWTDKNYFKNMVAYRRQIMLRLLKWQKNTIKVVC